MHTFPRLKSTILFIILLFQVFECREHDIDHSIDILKEIYWFWLWFYLKTNAVLFLS